MLAPVGSAPENGRRVALHLVEQVQKHGRRSDEVVDVLAQVSVPPSSRDHRAGLALYRNLAMGNRVHASSGETGRQGTRLSTIVAALPWIS
ncbi:MAG TPA: hypothetical protein VNG93_13840 [Candidatus Dormibacteraeota bacterium]|nr:hypothetical protein [Candidatus Dormibacteraeota bacterium]